MKKYTSLTESWAHEVGILEVLENTPDEEKLKKVLDLAKQTISVIFPDQNFVVKWIDGESRASLVSNVITLNPDPLFDPKVDFSFLERVDIIIGEAILSAGHRKSAILAAELMLRLWGRNKVKESIAFQIWSAAELNYSEQEIIKNYPGYAGYFSAYRKYYLTEEKRKAIQATIDATRVKTNLKVCVSVIVWELLCEHDNLDLKDYLPPVVDALRYFNKEKMSCFDRAYAASKVTDWLLDYYGEWEEYEKSLEKAATEEKQEQEKKKQEKQKQEKQEQESSGRGNESNSKEEEEEGDSEGSCDSDSDGDPGDEEGDGQGKSLEELIDECPMAEDLGVSKLLQVSKEVDQSEIDESNDPKEGDNYIDDFDFTEDPDDKETEDFINPRKANEKDPKIKEIDNAQKVSNSDKKTYQQDLTAIRTYIPPVLNSLKFRNEERKFKEFGLKRGSVDPGALSKLSYGDYNVFEREEIISKPNVHITLLVDESGSMNATVTASCPVCGVRSCNHMDRLSRNEGTRASIARKTAILLANSIKKIEGVDLSVYGHSSAADKCAFYRYYDRTNKKLECLGKIQARSENYDGYAIEHAGKLTLNQVEQEAYKLMIIICDGQPSASGYGGKPAMKHVRKVVQKLHSKHINTLAIGIGVPEEDIAYMYGSGYLCINKIDELPMKLAKIVSQIIRKQS